MKKEESWVSNPTKKQPIIVGVLWFIGIFLLTLAITDLFTKSFFGNVNLILLFLMLGSTATFAKVLLNYFKMKKR